MMAIIGMGNWIQWHPVSTGPYGLQLLYTICASINYIDHGNIYMYVHSREELRSLNLGSTCI